LNFSLLYDSHMWHHTATIHPPCDRAHMLLICGVIRRGVLSVFQFMTGLAGVILRKLRDICAHHDHVRDKPSCSWFKPHLAMWPITLVGCGTCFSTQHRGHVTLKLAVTSCSLWRIWQLWDGVVVAS
jgi:hypothetical protein